MVHIIESAIFSRDVCDYLSEDEFAAFQLFLSHNLDAGDVVKGSGGVRKIRWARQGGGKSSGVRIIYFAKTASSKVYLLLIYAKSARDSIPGHLLKKIKEAMEKCR